MGTRSLTHVLDDDSEAVLVTIYRQMDGYPSGLGEHLAVFLRGRGLVNGFGIDTPAKASNGMGCLAASLVAELKDGIGGIYLEPPGSQDHGEEYVYTIAGPRPGNEERSARPTLRAQSVRGGYDNKPRELVTLFEGYAEDFDAVALEKGETPS